MAGVVVVLMNDDRECVGTCLYFFGFSSAYFCCGLRSGGPFNIRRIRELKVVVLFLVVREHG